MGKDDKGWVMGGIENVMSLANSAYGTSKNALSVEKTKKTTQNKASKGKGKDGTGRVTGGIDTVAGATKAGYDITMRVASTAYGMTKDVASSAYDMSRNALTETKHWVNQKAFHTWVKISNGTVSVKQLVDNVMERAENKLWGLFMGGLDSVVDATKSGYDKMISLAMSANEMRNVASSATKDVAVSAYDLSKNAFTFIMDFFRMAIDVQNNFVHACFAGLVLFGFLGFVKRFLRRVGGGKPMNVASAYGSIKNVAHSAYTTSTNFFIHTKDSVKQLACSGKGKIHDAAESAKPNVDNEKNVDQIKDTAPNVVDRAKNTGKDVTDSAMGGIDNLVDATKAGYDNAMNIVSVKDKKNSVSSFAYDMSNIFMDTKNSANQEDSRHAKGKMNDKANSVTKQNAESKTERAQNTADKAKDDGAWDLVTGYIDRVNATTNAGGVNKTTTNVASADCSMTKDDIVPPSTLATTSKNALTDTAVPPSNMKDNNKIRDVNGSTQETAPDVADNVEGAKETIENSAKNKQRERKRMIGAFPRAALILSSKTR